MEKKEDAVHDGVCVCVCVRVYALLSQGAPYLLLLLFARSPPPMRRSATKAPILEHSHAQAALEVATLRGAIDVYADLASVRGTTRRLKRAAEDAALMLLANCMGGRRPCCHALPPRDGDADAAALALLEAPPSRARTPAETLAEFSDNPGLCWKVCASSLAIVLCAPSFNETKHSFEAYEERERTKSNTTQHNTTQALAVRSFSPSWWHSTPIDHTTNHRSRAWQPSGSSHPVGTWSRCKACKARKSASGSIIARR